MIIGAFFKNTEFYFFEYIKDHKNKNYDNCLRTRVRIKQPIIAVIKKLLQYKELDIKTFIAELGTDIKLSSPIFVHKKEVMYFINNYETISTVLYLNDKPLPKIKTFKSINDYLYVVIKNKNNYELLLANDLKCFIPMNKLINFYKCIKILDQQPAEKKVKRTEELNQAFLKFKNLTIDAQDAPSAYRPEINIEEYENICREFRTCGSFSNESQNITSN